MSDTDGFDIASIEQYIEEGSQPEIGAATESVSRENIMQTALFNLENPDTQPREQSVLVVDEDDVDPVVKFQMIEQLGATIAKLLHVMSSWDLPDTKLNTTLIKQINEISIEITMLLSAITEITSASEPDIVKVTNFDLYTCEETYAEKFYVFSELSPIVDRKMEVGEWGGAAKRLCRTPSD